MACCICLNGLEFSNKGRFFLLWVPPSIGLWQVPEASMEADTNSENILTSAPETTMYMSAEASFWRMTSSLGAKYSA
jgi:hypothetical protein